jgi:dipeptidyl-peptidase 4
VTVHRQPKARRADSGAPVTDWLDYDTHYTERFLGLPDANADAYKEASLLTYLADLKRPLLLIRGTSDNNVYFRHTFKLADALFRAGKNFECRRCRTTTNARPRMNSTACANARYGKGPIRPCP